MLVWYLQYYVFCIDALGMSETRDRYIHIFNEECWVWILGHDATRSPYVDRDDIWNPHAGFLHLVVCVICLLVLIRVNIEYLNVLHRHSIPYSSQSWCLRVQTLEVCVTGKGMSPLQYKEPGFVLIVKLSLDLHTSSKLNFTSFKTQPWKISSK